MSHFLIKLWCVMKSGFYMTTDQLSGWTEKKFQSTSQSQTCTKRVTVTIWWSAAGPIHYSFLNPGKTVTSEKYAQQIDEIHPKLQSLQLTLVNGRGQFFSLTTLDLMNFTMFTWPLFNQPPFLQASQQLFEGKMRPQPIGGIKFFQEFTESQNMDFYAIGINKLIFCGQKCVDCNGFYCDY